MKRVDTCAAEFEAGTPYMYSSYDGSCECEPTTERKVGVPQVSLKVLVTTVLCRPVRRL